MLLDYVSLVILIIVLVLVAYGIVAIYGIPHEIAKRRNHPHQDAIGAATWVSLFTLGVMWPFLWIWAMLYRPDREWGFARRSQSEPTRLDEVERRLTALERASHD